VSPLTSGLLLPVVSSPFGEALVVPSVVLPVDSEPDPLQALSVTMPRARKKYSMPILFKNDVMLVLMDINLNIEPLELGCFTLSSRMLKAWTHVRYLRTNT